MAEHSPIEWTDNTFNPWWGCERVSPACARCYADTLARRYGYDVWRAGGQRRFLSEAHWRRPLAWNRAAERDGASLLVFCASMADVFEDHPELEPWREQLWELIRATPWLQWQLLTKRPENVAAMAPWGSSWPANVWLGVSVENTAFTQRAKLLREIPARVRFISAEPLLASLFTRRRRRAPLELDGIDWLIVGGESGPYARPMDLAWARELRERCHEVGAAFFLKQLGGWPDKRGKEKALLDGRLWRDLPGCARTAPSLLTAST